MRMVFSMLGLLLAVFASGQDLTGIWRGQFRSNSRVMQMMNIDDRYKFEVQVAQEGKTFDGVTYSYKTTEFYGKAVAKGSIHSATKKVVLEELKIVDVRMRSGSSACIMTCFLQYYKNGNEEFLEGNYVSMNTTDSTDCGRGTVFLRRVVESDFFKEPFLVEKEKAKEKEKIAKTSPKSKPAINKPTTKAPAKPVKSDAAIAKNNKPQTSAKPAQKPTRPIESKAPPSDITTTDPTVKKAPPLIVPPVLKERENELVKTFSISTRTITVSLYDNGTIDKDTVSVYLNKKLVVSKKMLSLSPITINIELDDDNENQELVMVAENLGEIPPNTSLMVVKAGNQQFEVRITSTEQKNAVVIFKYEKPK